MAMCGKLRLGTKQPNHRCWISHQAAPVRVARAYKPRPPSTVHHPRTRTSAQITAAGMSSLASLGLPERLGYVECKFCTTILLVRTTWLSSSDNLQALTYT